MKKIALTILMITMTFFFVSLTTPTIIYADEGDLMPSWSHSSGFYTEGFYLTITPKPGTTVYYTLDGSTPTEADFIYTHPILIEEQYIEADGSEIIITENTQTIDGPLSMIRTSDKYWFTPQEDIFKATVIRMIAIHNETEKQSDIITQTYFVSPDMLTKYTFPIMALTTDPMNLYDYEKGINIQGSHYDINGNDVDDNETATQVDMTNNRTGNYFQTGDDWERPVYVQLFETSGFLAMAQNAGIRIHGGLSRKYPIKSYRLYARSEYDDKNTFNYQFFKDKDIDEFKKIILRNGGQSYQYTFMGEAFAQSLLKPLDLDIQYSSPIILFINGEYFGIRNVRDRFDTDYLKMHYGIDETQSTILTGHAYLEDGSRRGQAHYQQLYNYVTLRQINSLKSYQKIERWMDIDNYIDYMIAELYMGNVDWPQNNILYWRKNTSYKPNAPYGQDGRWRWMINDLDASFGISWGTINPDTNSFERLTGDSWKTGKLFTNLLENDQFKAKFIYRLIELTGTIFEETNVTTQLDAMIDLYEPEMAEHIARYGYPTTYQAWEIYTNRMKTFAASRNEYLLSYLESYLNLSEKHDVSITFDSAKGHIKVNGLNDVSGFHEGSYYDDIQVKIEAVSKAGYHLEGFYHNNQLMTTENFMYISPQIALDIEARFVLGDQPVVDQGIDMLGGIITGSILTLINISALSVILIKRQAKKTIHLS